MHLTANPAIHRSWYLNRIGQPAYDALEYIHSKSPHYTQRDLEIMLALYRKKLAQSEKVYV